jgi:polyferredoxin
MDKIGKPRGLIAYATLSEYQSNMALATGNGQHAIRPANVRNEDGGFKSSIRHFDWRIVFRPRTLLYTAIWAAVGIGLLVALMTRERLALNVLHDRNPQYVLESNGSIRNGYTVRILNMVPQPRLMSLTIEGIPSAVMKINGVPDAASRSFEVMVEPDEATTLKVFVTLPGSHVARAAENFEFIVSDTGGHETARYDAVFNAPGVKK